MSKQKKTSNAKYFSEEKWSRVNPKNVDIMEEFLSSKRELSNQTLKQYQNSLQIFFLWVLDKADNAFITELKKRDVLKYQNWLLDQGMSPNGIKFKRSSVSTLCNFIETYYDDKYPTFRNIVTGVEAPQGGKVHKKEPLTPDELNKLRKYLADEERWQQLAFLEIAYSTGCRREEVRQLRKEIAEYEINEKGYYTTHDVRTKGRGKIGNIRKLYFSEQAKQAIVKWLEVRGEDDCEYIFVSVLNNKETKKEETKQVNETAFNYWCSDIFAPVIGRRVHPHLLRSSRATHIVEFEGKDINTAKNLLGHASSETTEIYIVRDETESLNDAF